MKSNPIDLIDDLKVIRTIHSNKAEQYDSKNFRYLIMTIIVAVIVTFIGFFGADNLAKLLRSYDNGSKNTVLDIKNCSDSMCQNSCKMNNLTSSKHLTKELIFGTKIKLIMDLMTLSILVISILGLILNYEKRTHIHNIALSKISEFISDLEFNYESRQPLPNRFDPSDIKIYAERYKSLMSSLPPTTDKDYVYAIKTIQRKKEIKKYIESPDYKNDNPIKRKWKIYRM